MQFRVVGPDAQRLKPIAAELIEIMRTHPKTRDVYSNWRGMIVSVRLRMDQDKARALGINPQSLSRNLHSIMLTALTAILALIPLTQSTFWAPMAFAIMGGLLVATVLDRLTLPALYAAWFKVRPPAP